MPFIFDFWNLSATQGVKVIAFVGSDDKLKWCKDDLGFDHVFNYKKVDFSEEIAKVAPNGVEMFFDNVSYGQSCFLDFKTGLFISKTLRLAETTIGR